MASAAPPTDNKAFFETLCVFLEALSETFDDCPVLKMKVGMLEMISSSSGVWATAAAEWRSHMTPENVAMLRNKDSKIFAEVFDKHPLLGDIEFSKKWLDPTLPDESRETVWWYLEELAVLAKPELRQEGKKQRKKMKKQRGKTAHKTNEAEMIKIARRFCSKYAIDINEETGDVHFNYKKLLEANPFTDPDVLKMSEHVGMGTPFAK